MHKDDVSKIIESGLISIASSFPFASSLATGWTEYKSHKQSERIQSIFNELRKCLEELKEKIDESHLNTDKAKFLIEQTILKGKDEVILEKRKLYAHFLANSFTYQFSDDTEQEMVLDTISKLSNLQIRILIELQGTKNLNNYISELQLKKLYESQLFDSITLESCIDYMIANGIVETSGFRNQRATRIFSRKEIADDPKNRMIKVTKLGEKILSYIKF